MFVSFLLSLCTPLVLGVVWISELNRHELNWQRSQMVLDNTAILLGRSDREMVQRLEKDRSALLVLHGRLHKMRACSFIPATALHCARLVKLLQKAIRQFHAEALTRAQRAWNSGTALAHSELEKEHSECVLERTQDLRLRSTHCSLCFEVNGWNLGALSQLKSSMLDRTERKISTSVSLIRDREGYWTYRLWNK